MSKVSTALNLLALVKEVAPTACIMGGSARDIYHGKDPKDFDIIVPLGTPMEDLKRLAKELAVEGSYRCFKFGEGPYEIDDRVIMCIKLRYSGVDFDILLYNVEAPAAEAVYHLDFNINQFVLTSVGTAVFMGISHPKYGLVEVRGDAKPARKEYIQAKWDALYGPSACTLCHGSGVFYGQTGPDVCDCSRPVNGKDGVQ